MSESPNINTELQKHQENLSRLQEKNERYAKIRELAEDPYNRQKRPDDGFVAQGFFENFYQWRMERKGRKKDREEYWHKGAENIYGRDLNETAPSTKHTLFTLNFQETPKALDINTKRLIAGPDIEGETPIGKRLLRAKNLGNLVMGRVSVREYSKEKQGIKAERLKHGNKSHRVSYRRSRNANESFQRTGMISGAIRDWRIRSKQNKIHQLSASLSAEESENTEDYSAESQTVSPETPFSKELLLDLFSYSDTLDPEQAQEIRDGMEQSEEAHRYADQLTVISESIGSDAVLGLAENLRDKLVNKATDTGVPITNQGRSISWALWDIARYNFLFNEGSAEEKVEGDPFGHGKRSESTLDTIISRRLGIEIHELYQKGANILEALNLDEEDRDSVQTITKKGKRDKSGQLVTAELLKLTKIVTK